MRAPSYSIPTTPVRAADVARDADGLIAWMDRGDDRRGDLRRGSGTRPIAPRGLAGPRFSGQFSSAKEPAIGHSDRLLCR